MLTQRSSAQKNILLFGHSIPEIYSRYLELVPEAWTSLLKLSIYDQSTIPPF